MAHFMYSDDPRRQAASPLDGEQARLDAEDAQARLDRLFLAQQREDAARQTIKELTQQLRRARLECERARQERVCAVAAEARRRKTKR